MNIGSCECKTDLRLSDGLEKKFCQVQQTDGQALAFKLKGPFKPDGVTRAFRIQNEVELKDKGSTCLPACQAIFNNVIRENRYETKARTCDLGYSQTLKRNSTEQKPAITSSQHLSIPLQNTRIDVVYAEDPKKDLRRTMLMMEQGLNEACKKNQSNCNFVASAPEYFSSLSAGASCPAVTALVGHGTPHNGGYKVGDIDNYRAWNSQYRSLCPESAIYITACYPHFGTPIDQNSFSAASPAFDLCMATNALVLFDKMIATVRDHTRTDLDKNGYLTLTEILGDFDSKLEHHTSFSVPQEYYWPSVIDPTISGLYDDRTWEPAYIKNARRNQQKLGVIESGHPPVIER